MATHKLYTNLKTKSNEHETRNTKHETRNTKHETQNTKHATRNTLITLILMLFFSSFAWGQTPINNSYFSLNQPTYIWDMGGSPYLIKEDIIIPFGSNLIIEPGVEVLFLGPLYMEVKGSINAIGNYDERIVFKSELVDEPWNGIRFDFSDGTLPTPSKLYYCDISNTEKKIIGCDCTSPDCSGGAIFIKKFSLLSIYECEIFNNKVQGQGGAIQIYLNSNPTIEKCSIHDNYAHKKGGAIGILDGCNPILKGNNIYNNETDKAGGAISIGYYSPNNGGTACVPIINGNNIHDNRTNGIYNPSSGVFDHGFGGAISICGSNPKLDNNIFNNNTAYNNGGAIHVKGNSIFTISDCSFLENTSSHGNGGAIYLFSSNSNVSILSQFDGNYAINGGAIYVIDATTNISFSTFTNNTASADGGGIYTFQSTSTIEKCIFEDNTATGNGGGIYLNDPKENSTTYPATIPTLKLNSFKANTAYQGSALYCFRDNSNPLQYYTNPNHILNNLFAENNATDMGVVFMQGNNNNTIFNHNTVSNNSCTPPAFLSGVCIYEDLYKPSELKNNIIYESIVDILVIKINGQSAYAHPTNYQILAGYNYLNYDNNNNQNPAPGFVSAIDYHLTSTSPCVDPTGSINTATMTNTDLDGNNRIYNTKTDYGCYEYGSSAPARKGRTISANKDFQISVYPNPATDFLIINTSSEQNMDISIYSVSGQRVYFSENNPINGEELISLSDFKPGVYIIRVKTESKLLNKRIIVQ